MCAKSVLLLLRPIPAPACELEFPTRLALMVEIKSMNKRMCFVQGVGQNMSTTLRCLFVSSCVAPRLLFGRKTNKTKDDGVCVCVLYDLGAQMEC